MQGKVSKVYVEKLDPLHSVTAQPFLCDPSKNVPYLKNCLAKESASLKIPCSAVSLKQRELVFPDELSRSPGVGVLMEAPGEGAPFRVKFNSNPCEKLPCVGAHARDAITGSHDSHMQ